MSFSVALLLLLQGTAPAAPSPPAPAMTASQSQTKAQVDDDVKKYFSIMDRNRDGQVDRDESAKANAAMQAAQEASNFARLDVNKDGTISREEFKATSPQGPRRDVWFEANDIDRNGKVDLNEAIAKAERYFERLDADNDGTVTPEEMRALRPRSRRP